VVDVVSIALFGYKHLYLTAGLYAAFIVMCVMGYRVWQRHMRQQQAEAAVELA
jgi:nicotinamide mononucleotide transporter